MDLIAQELFHCLTEANTKELARLMNEWSTKYSVSYRACRRIPAFAKLWDAMQEACEFNQA